MKSCGKWVGLIAVVSLLPAQVRAAASDAVVTATPEETDEILANPGMGWETFHRTSKADKNLPSWIPSTVPYARWGWRELEPQPGKIADEFLDGVLKEIRETLERKSTMQRLFIALIMTMAIHPTQTAEQQTAARSSADKRPTKIWNRTGPLGETPKHVTDACPLYDQDNQGGWIKFEPMTDEFEGQDLDLDKRNRGMYWWKGRQPALFSDRNVTVSDGKLQLTMRKEKLPAEADKPLWYIRTRSHS